MGVLWVGLCLVSNTAAAEEEEAPKPPANAITEDRIVALVNDLSSDSYLRRKRATADLTRVGGPAVPTLVAELDSGELETTERVIGILQEIASRAPILGNVPTTSEKPAGEKAADAKPTAEVAETASPKTAKPDAWSELQRIATLGGSRGTRAKIATQEVRDVRRVTAMNLLREAGVFIGMTEFIIGSRSEQKRIVEINESFSGDIETLSLLRWIDGIEFARVRGAEIRRDVLAGVVQMPDLTTLSLVQGEIDADAMRTLGAVRELRRLELRYVTLTGDLVDQLGTLPIRVSLTLNGTAAPPERVEALRKTVPGLEIIFKQGGFLGVQCYDNFNECLINEVIRGQGAERAGLLPGDVVIAVDNQPVQRFKDLQKAIDAHMPGEQIQIRYERAGVEFDTTAQLGKLAEQ